MVYKVRDCRDRRVYAMKTVREQTDAGKRQIQQIRLEAEAELMSRLDHPAIPRVHEVFRAREQTYLVMEYVEGISLAELIQERGAQEETAVIGWAGQVCQVLSYLHGLEPPVIYRDLKPANLMLTGDGRIHLIDFGAAGTEPSGEPCRTGQTGQTGQTGKTGPVRVWGTRGYAPPEQYGGHTDPRSDLYGLGITVEQLITGEDPAESKRNFSYRRDRKNKRYRGYKRYRKYNRCRISAKLRLVLKQCTAEKAADRYPDCRSLYQALSEIEEEAQVRSISVQGKSLNIRKECVCIAEKT